MDARALLSAVSDCTKEIGLDRNLPKWLDNLLSQARRLVGFDYGSILLYEGDFEELVVQRSLGYGSQTDRIDGLRIPSNEGLLGWCVQNRLPIRVGDMSWDGSFFPDLKEVRSGVAVPLVAGAEVEGVLHVESRRFNAFSVEHEEVLTILGSHAALAIKAWKSQRRLQRKLRHLHASYEISRLATRGQDFDATLRTMLDIGQANIPIGRCALLLLDQKTQTLVVKAARGYRKDVKNLKIAVGKGITGQCAARGEILQVDDVRDNPQYIPGVEGARSEVAVPLKVEGRVIGVLNAEARQAGAYRKSHLQMLKLIAEQAAIVIENTRKAEEMRILAETDSLTKLSNRHHFWKSLEEAVELARSGKNPLSVVFFDLDHFKQVNDRYGHLAGDYVLRQFATTLKKHASDRDIIGRLGGEEFGLVIRVCDRESAHRIAERIRREAELLQLESDAGRSIEITVSAGIAVFPSDGLHAEELFKAADQALYLAKHHGRNCIMKRPDVRERRQAI